MTLASQMETDVADVFLNTDEHAQTVTRVAGGVSTSVNAVWEPMESQSDTTGPEVTHETGKALVWRGRLYVASSQTVAETDEWTIDGETYQCVEIGKPSGGMRVIHLQNKKRVHTNQGSRVLL